MSLPLLVCLLLPEPDPIMECHDTVVELSGVTTCASTVILRSGADVFGPHSFDSEFTNSGPPSARIYVLTGEPVSDGFEGCREELPAGSP